MVTPTATQSKYPTSSDLNSLLIQPVREVGDQAVWSLSSCKTGYGVEQLRDDNINTYWQSDGPQPHIISVQFRKKTTITYLAIYSDYKSDESYTPSNGTNFNDLKEFKQIELHEPCGWTVVELQRKNEHLRTFMLQVAVLQNHQNGRDTHIRQIKVYGPLTSSGPLKSRGQFPEFSTVDMVQYVNIR